MKSRDPTADQVENIRRLLAQAGSAAVLKRWIAIAGRKPKRPRGRPAVPKYPDDVGLLLCAGFLQLRNPQLSRSKAIDQIVTSCWDDDGVKGHSKNAVKKRLLAKLAGRSLTGLYDAWLNHPDTRTFRFNTPQTSILSA